MKYYDHRCRKKKKDTLFLNVVQTISKLKESIYLNMV